MKRLSDYTGDEAIEKVGELLSPYYAIISDTELMTQLEAAENKMAVVGEIMKKHKKEAYQMVTAVDDSPVTAANAFPRFFSVFTDLMSNKDFTDFFGSMAANMQ